MAQNMEVGAISLRDEFDATRHHKVQGLRFCVFHPFSGSSTSQ